MYFSCNNYSYILCFFNLKLASNKLRQDSFLMIYSSIRNTESFFIEEILLKKVFISKVISSHLFISLMLLFSSIIINDFEFFNRIFTISCLPTPDLSDIIANDFPKRNSFSIGQRFF